MPENYYFIYFARLRVKKADYLLLLQEHTFPSLLTLQKDKSVLREAKKYMSKILRRIVEAPEGSAARREALGRPSGANALLFIGLLMDETVFTALCNHLRLLHVVSDDHQSSHGGSGVAGGQPAVATAVLPLEVEVSLEALLIRLDDGNDGNDDNNDDDNDDDKDGGAK